MSHRSPHLSAIIRPRRLDEIPLWSIILAVVMLASMLTMLTDRMWPPVDKSAPSGINSPTFA